ncbi:MAG: flagellar filament capping protein FliD, partial [Chitinophagaceae bacterium]|nr:flagellar filament capping protein FliD [Rubrivivax sp.]
RLRGVLNAPSAAAALFPRLSDIGLALQRDGTLAINQTKLDAALTRLPELKKAFGNTDTLHPENEGFARRYANLANQVLSVDGSLTTRTEGLRKAISQNTTDQDKLAGRVETFRSRLVAQYTAMDANLAKLNALSSYVTQQLAALSKNTST